MEFGSQLKAERERRAVTLDRLCLETKLSLRHLEALERDDLQALPGGVFRRGMVKACVDALGLDPEAWLPRFDAMCRERLGEDSAGMADWAAFAENVKRNRVPAPSGDGVRWAGVLALLVTVAAAVWALWTFVLKQKMGH